MRTSKFVALGLTLAALSGCGTAPLVSSETPTVDGTVAARAAVAATSAEDPAVTSLFKALDRAHDGRLSLSDFSQLGLFAIGGGEVTQGGQPDFAQAQTETFRSLDIDGNGDLSEAEFAAYGERVVHQGVPGLFASATSVRQALGIAPGAPIFFEDWLKLGIFGSAGFGPTDGNPNPPLMELQRAAYDWTDSNRDGLVDDLELQAYVSMVRQHLPATAQ